MHERSSPDLLTERERCFERLGRARFGAAVTCVHCGSEAVVKRGTTRKGARKYRCRECETYFNDLTNTVFGQRRFALEEMCYVVRATRYRRTARIARELDRDYDSVLDFVHDVRRLDGGDATVSGGGLAKRGWIRTTTRVRNAGATTNSGRRLFLGGGLQGKF